MILVDSRSRTIPRHSIPRSFRLCRAIKLHSVTRRNLTEVRAVNLVEADTISAVVVQDFDGVAVEDGDDEAGEVRSSYQ